LCSDRVHSSSRDAGLRLSPALRVALLCRLRSRASFVRRNSASPSNPASRPAPGPARVGTRRTHYGPRYDYRAWPRSSCLLTFSYRTAVYL
jgi:hypothetical protein